jgi:hypothetical protein
MIAAAPFPGKLTDKTGGKYILAAAGCLAIKNKAAGQDRVAADGQDSQMAGTISSPGSPGSLGQSPGSSSGTVS